MAAILAWRHSFYHYNFYVDQSHGLDRIGLWVLAALVFWRPFFVIPFLSAVLVVIGQFELTPSYSLADSLSHHDHVRHSPTVVFGKILVYLIVSSFAIGFFLSVKANAALG